MKYSLTMKFKKKLDVYLKNFMDKNLNGCGDSLSIIGL